ncbi:serine/threonine-protein kinase D1-like isoform X1 [Gordionus sp. m RMFG-2023]|uniref:serine/threonine-protein kinase D1-like isoform X1 n=1 Tax=Gordionus sp. m RMFG-2023 TaxID=3053472 RepID=UPI0031FE0624
MSSKINIIFQTGVFREGILVEKAQFDIYNLKNLALLFLQRVFSLQEPLIGIGIQEKDLMLFYHNYESPCILDYLTDTLNLTDNSMIEIVLRGDMKMISPSLYPHSLHIHSYKSPAFCDFCGEMLFGLVRQGLKCEGCGLSFHKRCAFKIPNNCSQLRSRCSSTSTTHNLVSPNSSSESVVSTVSGSTVLSTNNNLNQYPCFNDLSNIAYANSKNEAKNELFHSTSHRVDNMSLNSLSKYNSLDQHNLSSLPFNFHTLSLGVFLFSTHDISNNQNSNTANVFGTSSMLGKRRNTFIPYMGRPFWMEREIANRIKIPHTLMIHSYKIPTICQKCKKLLLGLFRQGLQCRDCKFNSCKKCAPILQKDCQGSPIIDEPHSPTFSNLTPVPALEDLKTSDENQSEANDSLVETELEEENDTFEEHLPAQKITSFQSDEIFDKFKNNIPLQRMVVSLKYTKKRQGTLILKDGWMVHYTNRDNTLRRHYWVLDTNSLTFYKNEMDTNFYRRIVLDDIVSVLDNESKAASHNRDFKRTHASSTNFEKNNNLLFDPPLHCFEIVMESGLIYYVGVEEIGNGAPLETGLGYHSAKQWEISLKQALTPKLRFHRLHKGDLPNVEEENGSTIKTNNKKGDHVSTEDNDIHVRYLCEMEEFQNNYTIFPKEVLGSGQFGTVYGGLNKKNGGPIAVKVILKSRFPSQKESQLKNEVKILQTLSNPGVVNLDRMYESEEKIIVVMEKLAGDMLEMILNNPKGLLSETVARFLVYQILIALRYLHNMNIVHCDLKPENVLLSSYIDFPQVKLCDFGFARIIGEKSFRRSIVGTPAYLAPEVLRNQGYNRSLDMWSVGVIIYVSLSGTFPFNEEEDINDQIQNAAFMYPHNTWENISNDARDLIDNLLRVKIRLRYSVNKCLMHPWLQNYTTWEHLRKLEQKVGKRYITDEIDDIHWKAYKK